ncbi:MAG TPA: MgtC/SapB family protein [Candidatus Sulfopaludibacter sp.]|nr:MgtC/SapB family protein [Candidatus Sulfopaludibacter sp.]
MQDFYRLLPPEGAKIVLVLFLSFLTGLEREEHRGAGSERFSFGGVRTFPLIGLISYGISLLSGGQILPVALGFAVVAAFLMLSYHHKLETSGLAGVTSEMSGLATYVVAALVYREQYWIATTITVASIFLLELKGVLEGLTTRIPPPEILTFAKFLLLSAVILPILPNQAFGPFQINPAKTWLVVVAVSSVSYGSYVIQKLTTGKGGVILSALLGGAYSSTVTTVVLARRAARERRPHLFSGVTLVASGVMYLRLAGLVALFNRGLIGSLGIPFGVLALAGIGGGWLWSRRPDGKSGEVEREYEPKNPLELRAALFFAALFLGMLIVTHLAVTYLGKAGVFSLAALMGVTDVDPFIMGMTQSAGGSASFGVAAAAILIAAASNNVAKGVYAYSISDRNTGIQSLALLAALAAAGLAPLIWLAR